VRLLRLPAKSIRSASWAAARIVSLAGVAAQFGTGVLTKKMLLVYVIPVVAGTVLQRLSLPIVIDVENGHSVVHLVHPLLFTCGVGSSPLFIWNVCQQAGIAG
jgi:hypothetical protein